MNIDLMRYVDYWLGVPICFLLSILNFLMEPTRFIPRNKKVKKGILFIKLSEMGAIILAYPLLKRAKQDYPDSELFFLTFRKNKYVFEILDNVIPDSNILTIREDSIISFILDTFRVIKIIRKSKIDATFDLEFFSRFTAIISYLAGAEKRIGFYSYGFEGLYRGSLFTHNIQYNPLIHVSKTYLSLWQVLKENRKISPELGTKIDEKDIALPRFISAASPKEGIEDKLSEFGIGHEHRLFLLSPGEGVLPLREWPLDNFSTLVNKILLEDSRNYIILVGTASEKSELLHKKSNNTRCVSLVGKTSIPELLELCNISKALIINDCGLAHIASLTPIKQFIFFGPESPQLFGPLGDNNCIMYSSLPCSPCLSVLNHRVSSCKDNKCLSVIKPEEVFESIRVHLSV